MNLLVVTLLLMLTIFYPAIEMEGMWYLLLFKHWKYQTHSAILLAQAKNYITKADICIRLGDHAGAYKMNALSDVSLKKAKALRDGFEVVMRNFKERYII